MKIKTKILFIFIIMIKFTLVNQNLASGAEQENDWAMGQLREAQTRMERMMREVEKRFFKDDFFDSPMDDPFDRNFFGLIDQNYMGGNQPQFEWEETKTEKILKVKTENPKDFKITFNVKNHILQIKGSQKKKVEKDGQVSLMETFFNQTIVLDDDLDPDSMKVSESKEGPVVRFKKITGLGANSGNAQRTRENENKKPVNKTRDKDQNKDYLPFDPKDQTL